MSITECPECHRRLLSQASARCNWCGHLIQDPDYQTKADADRAAYFEHQKERDALGIAAMDAPNSVGSPTLRIFDPIGRRAAAGRAAYHQQMRAADAEIQARLAAERLAQERAAPREITAFGFPTNARENQPRQAPAAAREAEETEAEEATSRFNHLEL